jgi:hypothetical protein
VNWRPKYCQGRQDRETHVGSFESAFEDVGTTRRPSIKFSIGAQTTGSLLRSGRSESKVSRRNFFLDTIQAHREDTDDSPEEFQRRFPVGAWLDICTTIEITRLESEW